MQYSSNNILTVILYLLILHLTYGFINNKLITTKLVNNNKLYRHTHLHNSNDNIIVDSSNTETIDLDDNAWDFIDDIFLITTKENNNRLLQTKQELIKSKILTNNNNRVKIRVFNVDKEDKVRGCYTSHMKILEEIERTYKNKKDYTILILEDNLETTKNISNEIVNSIKLFINDNKKNNIEWDIFHLAYMMYVPNMRLQRYKQPNNSNNNWNKNIVRMIASTGASVGTSSYLISRTGVEKLLSLHRKQGFVEAVPNVMADLFPNTRYAAYPMIFHRAGKVGSLVNPQLDDFRRVMFSPSLYTLWEKLMVTTGLENNQLFPSLVITLLIIILTSLYNILFNSNNNDVSNISELIIAIFPLGIALWGASLFKPGNKGAGFATTTQQNSDN